jgi:hypothetical protein
MRGLIIVDERQEVRRENLLGKMPSNLETNY